MSRIGRNPIPVPSGAKVKSEGSRVLVEGPKGKLSMDLPELISVAVSDKEVQVKRANDDKPVRALHGLSRALIANMVHGVTTGFSKDLEISGVGYRAQMQGQSLTLNVGLSHQVVLEIPEGITVKVSKPTALTVEGYDKQVVGQFAADIRQAAPPEPYKGKGIRYAGEIIRRKAGKAATGAGGKG